MVGVLVRLKLRVLRNSLHGRQIAGMVVGGLFGLLGAAFTIGIAVFPVPQARITVDLLTSVYAVWAAGWILAPIATGGGDDTLRPEHFALLPIPRRRLAIGLLAASFVGVTALISLLAFFGLFAYGLRLGAGAAFVGLVFTVLQLAFVVLLYRVVIAALGALLTSRKGKELGIVLVALTGLSGVLVNYAINSLGPAIVNGRLPGFVNVVHVLPSGWGTLAVHAAGDGAWGTVGGLFVAMLAVLAVLVAAWGALLARQVSTPSFQGASRTRTKSADRRTRRGLLPQTPVGAVARKELHTWWRDARRRVALLSTLLIGVVVTVVPTLSGGKSVLLPYFGVAVVVFACLQAGNLYGLDGSALWHTLVVPGATRADVRGRQLAWLVLVTPIALVLTAALPGPLGRAWAYPWLFGLLPALLGAGAGLLMLQSVFLAFPLPDQRRNGSPWSSGGRPGCTRVLLMFATMLLLVVGALPVLALCVAGALADLPVLQWLGVPAGIATGIGLAWWWGTIAQRRLATHGPELLATVGKER
ncbi:transporter [Amycolatopsis ultiminotia]|uniref:Transporter n=1 Tax=Amycolatopsis ultiminotia TaxID=543629 RepID=A0ABP6WAI6_9PSEU